MDLEEINKCLEEYVRILDETGGTIYLMDNAAYKSEYGNESTELGVDMGCASSSKTEEGNSLSVNNGSLVLQYRRRKKQKMIIETIYIPYHSISHIEVDTTFG